MSPLLRSTLKKQQAEIERLEGQDVASNRERQSILQELKDAQSRCTHAEEKLAKVLDEGQTLREQLEGLQASASAEASRSSRLDGRCSMLEVESRGLRDELAASNLACDESQEGMLQLRRELETKNQELARLQSQLRQTADEASEFQAGTNNRACRWRALSLLPEGPKRLCHERAQGCQSSG
eukprot:g6852.t1